MDMKSKGFTRPARMIEPRCVPNAGAAVAQHLVTLGVNRTSMDYTKGFVADVDGHATLEIPYINGRIEGDAFILLILVVSSRRAGRSANNE